MLPAIQGNPGSRLAAGDAQSCRFASLASVGGIGWSHLASFHASHIFRFVNFLLEVYVTFTGNLRGFLVEYAWRAWNTSEIRVEFGNN